VSLSAIKWVPLRTEDKKMQLKELNFNDLFVRAGERGIWRGKLN
jgi:hypothetical protein